MMKKTISALAILLVAGSTVIAAEVDFKKINCVVANKPVNNDSKTADYKDGKVYFCCGGCAGKFAADNKKYATKANHQLVATKQFEQKACPVSGNKVNPETMVKLGGTELGFCCFGCKGSFESKADDKEKMEMVFNEKAFAKAFKKVESKEDGR